MRIRCERCATTYELDEKRLPPHGALVKCTRCDHVFRAAPPAPGSGSAPPEPQPVEPPGTAGEERTALFGFTTPPGEEKTASLAAVPPPEPATARRREPPASAQGAGRPPTAQAARKRSPWPWLILAALLVALAIAVGWYVVQRRVATPTTRLPAGVEFLPT